MKFLFCAALLLIVAPLAIQGVSTKAPNALYCPADRAPSDVTGELRLRVFVCLLCAVGYPPTLGDINGRALCSGGGSLMRN